MGLRPDPAVFVRLARRPGSPLRLPGALRAVIALMALPLLGLNPLGAAAEQVTPGAPTPGGTTSLSSEADYEYRPATEDGSGKYYFGREIALVMGHEGADWLERPERSLEERPDLLLPLLRLKPGEQVADIGAGSGYYTWRLAKAVGPSGRVYAVDIQPEMLQILSTNLQRQGVSNVQTVLGTEQSPTLPDASLDLAILVDVYHEFSHPREMLSSLCRAMKAGGRVVFVEFRAEDPAVPIKPVHKMSEAQVRREMSVHPLTWVETLKELPWQHVIVFRRNP